MFQYIFYGVNSNFYCIGRKMTVHTVKFTGTLRNFSSATMNYPNVIMNYPHTIFSVFTQFMRILISTNSISNLMLPT